MKKSNIFLAAFILMLASACSSTYHAGSNTPDDVYYSPGSVPASQPATYPQTPAAQPGDYTQSNSNYDQGTSSGYDQQPDYSSTTQSQDQQGNTYITNNYNYNEDDYYDYEYSSRIRRFYTPVYGYGYYNPYYTNQYWYDYNPVSWGVSIYLGYDWWAPSFYYNDPFCYGGISIGYSPWYSPWHYPHYYSPWYAPTYFPWYSGFGGYWNGYNNGYYAGYYDGLYSGYYGGYHNPYYYNSYDATSYYYGPRGSSGGNSPRPEGRQNSNTLAPVSLAQKYQEAVHEGRVPALPAREVNGTATDLNGLQARPSKTTEQGKSNVEPVIQNLPSRDLNGNTNTRPGLDQNNTGNTKNPVQNTGTLQQNNTLPSKGIISDKNLNGNQPSGKDNSIQPSDNSLQPVSPGKYNTVPSRQQPATQPSQKNNNTPQKQPAVTPGRNSNPGYTTPAPSRQPQKNSGKGEMQNNSVQPSRRQQSVPQRNNSWQGTSPSPSNNYNQNQAMPSRNNPDNRQQMQEPSVQPHRDTQMKQEKNRKNDVNLNMRESQPNKERRNSFFDFSGPRNDSRSEPIVQPRNEPRQFRNESSPAPQRMESFPQRSNSGSERKTGRPR